MQRLCHGAHQAFELGTLVRSCRACNKSLRSTEFSYTQWKLGRTKSCGKKCLQREREKATDPPNKNRAEAASKKAPPRGGGSKTLTIGNSGLKQTNRSSFTDQAAKRQTCTCSRRLTLRDGSQRVECRVCTESNNNETLALASTDSDSSCVNCLVLRLAAFSRSDASADIRCPSCMP
jgi:hypothetical protein